MADFIYNATGGTLASNFAVKSDYLTPTVYPQHFCTSFYIELYGYDFDGREVYYITTLKGDIISGNIDRDRSSEYIGSCSLEIALSDDCIFNCDENYTWENKIIKIIKTYDFLNDKNYSYKRPLADEPYFEDKEETDIKLSLGYYVVDSTSCKYDQSSRTLSLSGTDLLSIFGAEHGSTLIDYENGKQDINGLVVPSVDDNGAHLEVNSTIQTLLMTYSPIELIKDGVDGCYINVDDWWAKPQNEWTTIDLIPGDNEGLYIPYDLEFNEAVYLLDPLKKIKDLYEERIIYMSTEKIRFMMRRMPRSWADILYCNWVFGRQLTNLVMSENVSIDRSGVYNCYDVYGKSVTKTETKTSKATSAELAGLNEENGYTKTDTQKSGDDINFKSTTTTISLNPTTKEGTKTSTVTSTTTPHAIFSLDNPDHPLSTNNIGVRKMTIQDDTCFTNEDCYNAGRWKCIKNVEFKEKTTIVLCDNFVKQILENDGLENLGVGGLIEYTSIHTGETNLYMLNKLSHSFTDGTWTLEMQPFKPIRDTGCTPISNYPLINKDGVWMSPPAEDRLYYDGGWKLSVPRVTYEKGEKGKVTFRVNNKEHTRFSLFKFFIDDKFIGETCTEDENYWKVFKYQFENNGTYKIYVSAYSSFYEPSEKTWISIKIDNIDNAILTDTQNNKLTDENYNLLTE